MEVLLNYHKVLILFFYSILLYIFFQSAKIPFAYPTAKDYARNAFRTLGISGRTSGYFGHSLFLWIFQKICTPTENSLVISNAVKQGKEAYENALIMKQKKQ